jgi:ABC-type antimicrobial peptide transport system permease subunit
LQNAETPAASDVVLMVRSNGDPRSVERDVERNIHTINKDLALYESTAMDRYYLETLSQQRLFSALISVLAAFGLLLGSLGIYGTLSFAVAERVREIGIRMALGADRPGILRLVMKQGLRLTLLAAVLGLGAAWAMGRLLSTQLSDIPPGNAVTLLAATLLLLAVASFAIYLPARRAAGVEPMIALKQE